MKLNAGKLPDIIAGRRKLVSALKREPLFRALRYLADRHNPADVVFVDGWTGKGAITREEYEGMIRPLLRIRRLGSTL